MGKIDNTAPKHQTSTRNLAHFLSTTAKTWKTTNQSAHMTYLYYPHGYLITHTDPPTCEQCTTRLNLIHLLNYCIKYDEARAQIYGQSLFPVYESLTDTKHNIHLFFQFVHTTNLIMLLWITTYKLGKLTLYMLLCTVITLLLFTRCYCYYD